MLCGTPQRTIDSYTEVRFSRPSGGFFFAWPELQKKGKGPRGTFSSPFKNVIPTDYRVDVRANRDGGLSTPVHSYSSYGEAHDGAFQHPRRRLWVLRKHPLLRALAPLSRRRARPRQWLRLRVSSWVLLSILSLLLRHTNGFARPAVPIYFCGVRDDGRHLSKIAQLNCR
jgi:hypothetical protein